MTVNISFCKILAVSVWY